MSVAVGGTSAVVGLLGSVEEVDRRGHLDPHVDMMCAVDCYRCFLDRVVVHPLQMKKMVDGVRREVEVPHLSTGADGEAAACARGGHRYCCYLQYCCDAVDHIPQCRQDLRYQVAHPQRDRRICQCCCFRRCSCFQDIGFRNLFRYPEAFLLSKEEVPHCFYDRDCTHMGFVDRLDHHFETRVFHRVLCRLLVLAGRIGQVADRTGCHSSNVVLDIDGETKRTDFDFRYGGHSILVVVPQGMMIPRLASAAVVVVVTRGSPSKQRRVYVDEMTVDRVAGHRDNERKNMDLVAQVVVPVSRKDLSLKMVGLHFRSRMAVAGGEGSA